MKHVHASRATHGILDHRVALWYLEAMPRMTTTIRLPPGLHRRLLLEAADTGRSANDIVAEALQALLDARGTPPRLTRRRIKMRGAGADSSHDT